MIFVTHPDVGRMVRDELRDAIEVRLAVAYFNPDEEVLTALCNVPRLTLVISEEFTINDPYKLEKLGRTATVRSVATYCESGRLHAKVLTVKRRKGGWWVLVGSANMTRPGLFSNQEACVALESENEGDETSVKAIMAWFDSLLTSARPPNFEEAKQLFDTRSRYRLERRPVSAQANVSAARYWALKTTSGDTGENHWQKFLRESVIAIGWPKIKVNPSSVSEAQLRDAVGQAYQYPRKKDPKRAANKIKTFVGLNIDDVVLICRGYPPKSDKPVRIYGFARVTGPFRDEQSSDWKWRFKHDAVIQVVDLYLPKDVVAKAIGKHSLRETIHELDRSGFDRLIEQLGVPLEV